MPAENFTLFQPERILDVLVRHGVLFVAIGGWAANLQGSPIPTGDVDITPKLDRENLSRLSASLKELGARIFTVSEPKGMPFDHDAESLAATRVWNLVTEFGLLDISFEPKGTRGFDDLDRDALDFAVNSQLVVRIASLADIVRSKEAAGRDKDRRALPVLREILAEQSADRRVSRRRRTEPPAQT